MRGREGSEVESLLQAGRKLTEPLSTETAGVGNSHRNVMRSLMLIPQQCMIGPVFSGHNLLYSQHSCRVARVSTAFLMRKG